MRGSGFSPLAIATALVTCAGSGACSSSSTSSPPPMSKDAATDAATDGRDATGHDASRTDAGRDSGTADARTDARHTSTRDTGVDAFVYPEAAIPHDAGTDTPTSRCSGLPDLSSYCAPKGSGGSTGFYVCMQGNSIYSPCSSGTLCHATDAGGVACQAP
jgi:hypothetical protein